MEKKNLSNWNAKGFDANTLMEGTTQKAIDIIKEDEDLAKLHTRIKTALLESDFGVSDNGKIDRPDIGFQVQPENAEDFRGLGADGRKLKSALAEYEALYFVIEVSKAAEDDWRNYNETKTTFQVAKLLTTEFWKHPNYIERTVRNEIIQFYASQIGEAADAANEEYRNDARKGNACPQRHAGVALLQLVHPKPLSLTNWHWAELAIPIVGLVRNGFRASTTLFTERRTMTPAPHFLSLSLDLLSLASIYIQYRSNEHKIERSALASELKAADEAQAATAATSPKRIGGSKGTKKIGFDRYSHPSSSRQNRQSGWFTALRVFRVAVGALEAGKLYSTLKTTLPSSFEFGASSVGESVDDTARTAVELLSGEISIVEKNDLVDLVGGYFPDDGVVAASRAQFGKLLDKVPFYKEVSSNDWSDKYLKEFKIGVDAVMPDSKFLDVLEKYTVGLVLPRERAYAKSQLQKVTDKVVAVLTPLFGDDWANLQEKQREGVFRLMAHLMGHFEVLSEAPGEREPQVKQVDAILARFDDKFKKESPPRKRLEAIVKIFAETIGNIDSDKGIFKSDKYAEIIARMVYKDEMFDADGSDLFFRGIIGIIGADADLEQDTKDLLFNRIDVLRPYSVIQRSFSEVHAEAQAKQDEGTKSLESKWKSGLNKAFLEITKLSQGWYEKAEALSKGTPEDIRYKEIFSDIVAIETACRFLKDKGDVSAQVCNDGLRKCIGTGDGVKACVAAFQERIYSVTKPIDAILGLPVGGTPDAGVVLADSTAKIKKDGMLKKHTQLSKERRDAEKRLAVADTAFTTANETFNEVQLRKTGITNRKAELDTVFTTSSWFKNETYQLPNSFRNSASDNPLTIKMLPFNESDALEIAESVFWSGKNETYKYVIRTDQLLNYVTATENYDSWYTEILKWKNRYVTERGALRTYEDPVTRAVQPKFPEGLEEKYFKVIERGQQKGKRECMHPQTARRALERRYELNLQSLLPEEHEASTTLETCRLEQEELQKKFQSESAEFETAEEYEKKRLELATKFNGDLATRKPATELAKSDLIDALNKYGFGLSSDGGHVGLATVIARLNVMFNLDNTEHVAKDDQFRWKYLHDYRETDNRCNLVGNNARSVRIDQALWSLQDMTVEQQTGIAAYLLGVLDIENGPSVQVSDPTETVHSKIQKHVWFFSRLKGGVFTSEYFYGDDARSQVVNTVWKALEDERRIRDASQGQRKEIEAGKQLQDRPKDPRESEEDGVPIEEGTPRAARAMHLREIQVLQDAIYGLGTLGGPIVIPRGGGVVDDTLREPQAAGVVVYEMPKQQLDSPTGSTDPTDPTDPTDRSGGAASGSESTKGPEGGQSTEISQAYQLMGLDSTASTENEVRTKFRELVKTPKYNPEILENNENFIKLTAARDLIIDSIKRRESDEKTKIRQKELDYEKKDFHDVFPDEDEEDIEEVTEEEITKTKARFARASRTTPRVRTVVGASPSTFGRAPRASLVDLGLALRPRPLSRGHLQSF